MKSSKVLIFLIILSLVVSAYFIWWVFFAIDYGVSVSKVATIIINKDKIKEHEAIYPTRLVSVNPEKDEACIEVKLPEKDWKKFYSKQGERFEKIGYYLSEVQEDKIKITVVYPGFKRGRLRIK